MTPMDFLDLHLSNLLIMICAAVFVAWVLAESEWFDDP